MKIKRDPYYYDLEEPLFKNGSIEIAPGLTALVGRNGSGKTTTLLQIEEYLKENEYKYIKFDQAGEDHISINKDRWSLTGDFFTLATAIQSSEGECISISFREFANKIGSFIRKNDDQTLFILIDALDSGFSIDNIIEVKHLFDLILKDNKQRDIYIICTANSYEMCSGEDCINVNDGQHISFSSYEEYRDFILKD